MAYCGMAAALSIVLLLIGSIAELGMYAAPMFAGMLLVPIGNRFGRKYHVLLWLVVSLLSFMLIPSPEQNLMYLCLFGCYPILWPLFMKIKRRWLRIAAKLLFFNLVVVAVEALVMLLLIPESLGTALAAALLVLGNLLFIMYDFLVPRTEALLKKLAGRIKK